MKTAFDTLIRLETREVEALRLALVAAADALRQREAEADALAQRQMTEARISAMDPLAPNAAWLGLSRARVAAGRAAAVQAACDLDTARSVAAERLARLRSIERLADDARRTAIAAREGAAQREIEDLQSARRRRP